MSFLNTAQRRQLRTRSKVIRCNKGNRPRIVISKSNKNFYAQLIQDGNVTCSASSLSKEVKSKTSGKKGVEIAQLVGDLFAKVALKAGASEVVFDKGSYVYNGRVQAFADACRKGGLVF